MLNRKKYFIHSYLKTNTAPIIKFHAHYVFTKMLIFSYKNAQMHPNVTVQYLKSIPFVQKAWKTCDHTSVSDKNQSSSQSKGFIHGLVQKILVTCERVANKFLHPGANHTYMYNLHTVCKSAHVNGALESLNFNLSVFFMHFNFVYHTNKATYNKS